MNKPRLLNVGIRDVVFGVNVTVVEPSNVYGCVLEDDVFVGPFVEIQREVVVGKRTRIQSHTFVCQGVSIGEDCFISHGVMFINDLFRTGGASRDSKDWKSTLIGKNVSIGSGATILPVTICEGAIIGAGAVVTKDITEPGIYVGNPARFRRVA